MIKDPTNPEFLAMKIFDHCFHLKGKTGNLTIVHPVDATHRSWKEDVVKVYHTDGLCWELIRTQKFTHGNPDGYTYQFIEHGEETGPEVAWGIVELELSSKASE